jgi:hypothetical protein
MSKFHLSKQLTELISNAVQAFALRLETDLKINKERTLEIWESVSDDIVAPKPKPKEEKKVQTVLPKLPERRFALRKNAHGNYEHTETGMVFDPQTKEVMGRQVAERIAPLSLRDVDTCKQLGFKYRLPETFLDEAGQEVDDAVSDLEEEEEDE